MQVIRKHGGDVADEYNPRSCTHLLAQNKCSELYRQVSILYYAN